MRHISLYSLVNRRQRRQQALFQSLRRRMVRAGLGCAVVNLLIFVSLLLAGSLLYAGLVKNLPSLDLLPILLNPDGGMLMQPTKIFDRSGQKLLMSLENPGVPRRYFYLDPKQTDHFSPQLVRVIVGDLDPLFWKSPGVDIVRLFDPQPHTIAERLVSDLLLSQEPSSLARALRMRLLAAQLIARYGQVQTLEWYLNGAYFGHLAFGADSAARLYLGVSAAALDLPQAAVLSTAIQAPALNPLDAPAVAMKRQKDLLRRLLDRRVIDEAEYLRAAPVEIRFSSPPDQPPAVARAFTQLVMDQLSNQISRERLERGGMTVITTLDYDLQLELACLVKVQLSRLIETEEPLGVESQFSDQKPCQSARLLPTLPPADQPLAPDLLTSAVVLDPLTGQVLALLGDTSINGETSTLAARQPGSLLAPFAAVASFARGVGPARLVWDIPSSLPEDLAAQPNPDGAFHGPVRLRQALANDYLAPQAQLIEQVGAANVWRLAGAMGLNSLVEEKSPAIIYQGGSVSPLELAQAYGVMAAQGVRVGQRQDVEADLKPVLVMYVEDSAGTAWLDFRQAQSQSVVSPQLSYLVHNVLGDVIARRSSLGSPNALEIGRPAGAKIGYVAGNRQVWAAGYTTRRVAVFWLGFPEKNTQQVDPKMAAGMWHALMQFANRALPVEDWPEPVGISKVDVCDPSGLLPTGACPEIASEIFLSGSEPTAPDNLYQKVQINRETGRLATVFTPAALVEEKVFMVVPFSAVTWAQAAGLPVPPKDYDAIQPPEPSTEVYISAPRLYSFLQGQIEISGKAAGEGFRFYQVLVGQGLNPQSWLQVGEDGEAPVVDDVLGVWDTTGLEGLYTIRLLVARQDQTLETATIQVTVDNIPPLVRIPYPLSGQEISAPAGATITFQAEASDTIGVNRVAWLVDGIVVGESSQTPYIFSWPAQVGEHQLLVKAFDQAGNEGLSETLRFRVVR